MASRSNPFDDPLYYTCPQCKAGSAAPTGYDTQKKRVYKCTKCDQVFGEYALEKAARERVRQRLHED